jgi:CRISPR-associated endoribonuclease Cas6/Csy4 subtype I-F
MMKHYMDIRLIPSAGMTPPTLAAEVVKKVHACLQVHPGAIALALPECAAGPDRKIGTLVRLFATDASHLNATADEIEAHKAISGMAVPTRIREVPAETTRWVAYTRFRLPNRRRQAKDTDAFAVRRQQLRAERMAVIDTLPTLYMSSATNGHRYGMGIQVVECDHASPQGTLNGYGLSSQSSPFWLPMV